MTRLRESNKSLRLFSNITLQPRANSIPASVWSKYSKSEIFNFTCYHTHVLSKRFSCLKLCIKALNWNSKKVNVFIYSVISHGKQSLKIYSSELTFLPLDRNFSIHSFFRISSLWRTARSAISLNFFVSITHGSGRATTEFNSKNCRRVSVNRKLALYSKNKIQ